MRETRTRRPIKWGLFPMLYSLFTLACLIIGWSLPGRGPLLLQIWYLATTAVWLLLLAAAAALTIRLLKADRARRALTRWKEER